MQEQRPVVCMLAYTEYAIDARVRREAETLAAAGFRVYCLTNGAHGRTRRVQNGVEIWELPVRKYQGSSTLLYLASYLHFLFVSGSVCAHLLFRRKLDVVHVHNLPDFLVFAAVLPKVAGCKVVLDIHDSVPETFAAKFSGRAWLWRLLCLEERLSTLLAHKVICVNEPQRNTLVARGLAPSKTFVSMNVPDPSMFGRHPDRDAINRRRDTFDLVYHGTMAERLGVDLIIRAVSKLKHRIPTLRLHLWGGGDYLPVLQRLSTELRLQAHVFFEPRGFPLQELPRLLSSADLGVIGNRRSVATDLMLPVKLIEYVSLHIPAVVPRLKTIEHYFTDDMVAFYEPESVASLSDALYRLYRDREAGRQQASRAMRFLETFGWESGGLELVTLYRDLVENRP